MKIGVLGTGMVGRALAAKLAARGHEVAMGTRDPEATRAKEGEGSFRAWHDAHLAVELAPLADAARFGALVFNVLSGRAAVEALGAIADELAGKVLVDVTNPLDFSKGMPPSLFVSNDDSLGECIQRALPRTLVVKSLNTLNASLMVEPGQLAAGQHSVFVSGDDAAAKETVSALLRDDFGHADVIDLGGIATARGTEMFLPLWLRLWGALKTPSFSVKVVR